MRRFRILTLATSGSDDASLRVSRHSDCGARNGVDRPRNHSVASIIGFGTNFYQEKLYQKHVATRGPEARLYASLIGGLVFPAGAYILAFSQGRGHWMGPVVGLTMIFTGVYTIYLAVFSYLADCYTIVSLPPLKHC